MTQSDNKKAPYKRGDIVQYKGNGVALVVEMYLGVAGINWIVVPTSGGFDKEWFFRSRHPECDFYVITDDLGEVLCHVPIPRAGAGAS